MKELIVKNAFGSAVPVSMVFDTYVTTGAPAIRLVVAKNTEDYFKGEPWSDLIYNMDILEEDEFALDHDFTDLHTAESVEAVLDIMAESQKPHRFVANGYVNFPIYRYKESFLEEINSAS